MLFTVVTPCFVFKCPLIAKLPLKTELRGAMFETLPYEMVQNIKLNTILIISVIRSSGVFTRAFFTSEGKMNSKIRLRGFSVLSGDISTHD